MTEPAPAPWALLLAAGDGTRLSEVTRGNDGVPVPKQFCSFGGGASLLGLARDRARRVVADARIVTVVAERHERWWRRELTGGRNVVVQPENRGTAVGLLLPLLAIAERDPDARVWVLPSDHWVRDEDTPARCAREAFARVHAEPDRIVLMGIEPDDADSQYGWVLPAEARDDRDFRPVASFVEKPPVHEARRLRERGAVWNSFLIVARARAGAAVRAPAARAPGHLAAGACRPGAGAGVRQPSRPGLLEGRPAGIGGRPSPAARSRLRMERPRHARPAPVVPGGHPRGGHRPDMELRGGCAGGRVTRGRRGAAEAAPRAAPTA